METALPLQANEAGIRHLGFLAMGTACSVKFRLEDDRKALEFGADVLGWIAGFEAKFSRYREDSVVSKINAAAGERWVGIDDETSHMLDLASSLNRRTKGILDPTLLPVQLVWDWRKARERLPETSEIENALALTGWGKVERRAGAVYLPERGMGLDFGGFGKEYAVDFVARMAAERGIQDALIDLGRDIFAMGGNGKQPFWHVGIEDGKKPGNCWGGLAVSGRAVSASGDYARYFTHEGKRYGHILDPRTGWPVDNGMRAVTVVAGSCLEAGAYSTAVYVLGAEEGVELAGFVRDVEVCAQTESGIGGTRNFGKWLIKAA
ncbi:FAD:protein FMN transferase [Akkermansiaceae bacterium]|nr:FAD:protein FMN transferase [Akkermansiaceae bacterium]